MLLGSRACHRSPYAQLAIEVVHGRAWAATLRRGGGLAGPAPRPQPKARPKASGTSQQVAPGWANAEAGEFIMSTRFLRVGNVKWETREGTASPVAEAQQAVLVSAPVKAGFEHGLVGQVFEVVEQCRRSSHAAGLHQATACSAGPAAHPRCATGAHAPARGAARRPARGRGAGRGSGKWSCRRKTG